MLTRGQWLMGIGLILAMVSLAAAEGEVVGVNCPITWTPPSVMTGIAGYRIYVTRQKGVYSTTPVKSIPSSQTTADCADLALTIDGQYYSVITSLGTNGKESAYSNESAFVRETTIPAAPTGYSVGK